ncbi:signal peptidase complex subunit 2 [Mortierella sp. GBAus27b]|nr:hypothetical protein BGX31_000350 [Mortierella sp. GBA43]KAI8350442.1 signal peptidase complex subunit 2 [Mortierella sp. GBAus27b]
MTNPTPRVFKADKSSLLELKNTCDDALKEYLESKAGFQQSHKHTDIKLFLGYLGCAFAAAGSYYGYIHPFELPDTKFWTLISVVLYYLFNVLMMGYMFFVEKNTIFAGTRTRPNGTAVISVGSSIKSYSPYYELDIRMHATAITGTTKRVKRTHQKFSTAVNYWFDEDGVLDSDSFEADIAKFLANTEATHSE